MNKMDQDKQGRLMPFVFFATVRFLPSNQSQLCSWKILILLKIPRDFLTSPSLISFAVWPPYQPQSLFVFTWNVWDQLHFQFSNFQSELPKINKSETNQWSKTSLLSKLFKGNLLSYKIVQKTYFALFRSNRIHN